MAGIYVHIPFCKQACYYCDFHFSTNQEVRPRLVDALRREAELQHDFLGTETVETVYLGGGTPSLLTAMELEQLMSTLRATFPISSTAEITLEANPDDLTESVLHQFVAAGINRLSIGIQSFQEETLRFFNRAHSVAQALSSVEQARRVGFANISIDLIYGIPGTLNGDWMAEIRQALALGPEHISAYALTIEEKTVLGNWHKRKKLVPADEEHVAQQFELLMHELEQAGYAHYEISNFCRPGFASRHNSAYWQGVNYLGLGPSAHSLRARTRQFNVANNALYLQAIERGEIPLTVEALTDADCINEAIFTGLRTQRGVYSGELLQQFGFDLPRLRSERLERLAANGWIDWLPDRIVLTRKGKLVADQIASDLFTDEAELGTLKKTS